MSGKRILLASPRGFCAGVRRAIAIAEAALDALPHPVYCLKEIVHNRQVVEDLKDKGLVFIDDLHRAPAAATVLFSAHGVSPAVRQAAQELRLRVIDATCPFVRKVHAEVKRYARAGCTILLIGKRDHDEIAGVAGEAPDHVIVVEGLEQARAATVPASAPVAVVTQTTLSVEETAEVMAVLGARFPGLRTPPDSDICYATTNRQKAVREIARRADRVLVLGSANSSNSNRLVEVARCEGRPALLIPAPAAVNREAVGAARTLGVTAGASTPERFLQAVLDRLHSYGFRATEEVKVAEETIEFPLPRALRPRGGPAGSGRPDAAPPAHPGR